MKVHFNSSDEYFQELKASAPFEGAVARVTKVYESRNLGSFPMIILWVVAGVMVRGELFELERRVGDYISTTDGGDVVKRADELVDRLEEALKDLGCETRAGRYVSDAYRSYQVGA